MQEQRGGPTTTRNQRREREREERCHLPTRPQHAALRSVKPRVPKEWVCDLGLGLGPGGPLGQVAQSRGNVKAQTRRAVTLHWQSLGGDSSERSRTLLELLFGGVGEGVAEDEEPRKTT